MGVLETDDLRMQRYNLPLVADERLELVRREVDRIVAERAGLPAPPGLDSDAESAALPERELHHEVEREVERA